MREAHQGEPSSKEGAHCCYLVVVTDLIDYCSL